MLSKTILQEVAFSSNDVHLIVDKSKGKKQRNIFNQYLQTNIETILNIGMKFRINHEQSHNNHGLQAIDLFCSGFSKKYAYNDTGWYDVFKHKIAKEIVFNHSIHK